MFRGRVRHVHFVGVGGIGMSGIAEILRSLDYDVSGSDLKASDVTKRLEGLGVRDLRADGDDVLILAGPTMTLDGQVTVFRWIGALADVSGDTVNELEPGVLEPVLTLPSGHGEDRPEGFMFLPSGEQLVVYDSPSDTRLIGEHGVLADIFTLPGR